jgi:Protein of unknown function (DUF3999)
MMRFMALLLAPALACAADGPAEFAYAVPISMDGLEALYEIELPAAVYQGVTRPDLADVRVFNADGEAVPFAFEPRPARQAERQQPVSVKRFPLHGARPADLEALQLRVERAGGGTIVSVRGGEFKGAGEPRLLAYLLDASQVDRPYEALELDWRQNSASFAMSVQVQASDDLRSWSTVVYDAPLVRIDYGGQRLEQRTIEFRPLRAKYLRLSWPAGASEGPLQLTRTALRIGDLVREPERMWKQVQAAAGGKAGEYAFDTGGRFSIERVRLALPQDNTVARIALLARADPAHDWTPVANTVVYRLTQQGQSIVSPDLPVTARADRYWLVRVDQNGGGLGSGSPVLSVGWVPQKLVFAARGTAPFQIAYGSSRVKPAAYPIETVVPGWRSDRQPKLAQAQAGPERMLAGPAALRRQLDYKVWGLWTALVLGVALLAWMAWRLAKQMQSPAEKRTQT